MAVQGVPRQGRCSYENSMKCELCDALKARVRVLEAALERQFCGDFDCDSPECLDARDTLGLTRGAALKDTKETP